MIKTSRLALWVCGVTMMAAPPGGASAQSATTVLGGGMAQACSMAARAAVKAAEFKRSRMLVPIPADALIACDRALQTETLTVRDLAATYVNRGVLLMGRANYPLALADYESALHIKPKLAEAHANRGAALIALYRDQEGIDAITQGLALQTEEPEKSYYNRAIARERLDDMKGAYLDYLKASELKPDWEDPRLQMTRFTLTPK
jgi:tetratricopeptide (TPR) repeat protein